MHLIKLVLSAVIGAVAFIIAAKLLVLILGLIGLALKLVWLAAIVGVIALIGWVIYKVFSFSIGAEHV